VVLLEVEVSEVHVATGQYVYGESVSPFVEASLGIGGTYPHGRSRALLKMPGFPTQVIGNPGNGDRDTKSAPHKTGERPFEAQGEPALRGGQDPEKRRGRLDESQEKRDFSLRGPTLRRKPRGRKSACSVRNDSVGWTAESGAVPDCLNP